MPTNESPKYIHPSGDRILSLMAELEGSIGEFIRAYPGKTGGDSSSNWLDLWFHERIRKLLRSQGVILAPFNIDGLLDEIAQQRDPIISKPVRITSLRPHYFRGFRSLIEPIRFWGDLVVIDGKNSSGKTSLSEALEWLLTGQLIRRHIQQYGDARELENCISNQLRPEGEPTLVEAVFATEANENITLKRVLRKDYGNTQTSRAESILYLNDKELGPQEEVEILDDLFAGIPPILMQHSLRLFVHSSCAERRNYFEKLLRMDELTYLIEKAVVTDSRFAEFPSPTGSLAYKRWENLRASVKQSHSKTVLRNTGNTAEDKLGEAIEGALLQIAKLEFANQVQTQVSLEQAVQAIKEVQKRVRQQSFPLLERIRPSRVIDDQFLMLFSPNDIVALYNSVKQSHLALVSAQRAANLVGDAQIAIASAFKTLENAGLVVQSTEPQVCPLCDYREVPTLIPARVEGILAWIPTQKMCEEASAYYGNALHALRNRVTKLRDAKNSLLPACPTKNDWDSALETASDTIRQNAVECHQTMLNCLQALQAFEEACSVLLELLKTTELSGLSPDCLAASLDILIPELKLVTEKGYEYAASFANLDKAIGSQAKEDPSYHLRDSWLSIVDDIETTKADLLWERAKKKAQKELEGIREMLILARQKLLTARREDFNESITSIWQKLRSDTYTTFSQLYIPEPRGRGFPIEIEVKATLTDGAQTREVDALRIFSESQVNVVGIASFVTRSKLVGHRMLVFDDPVQSMDEEHFKTFATQIIPELLRSGLQVILLTHNDTFAREVSLAHFESVCYTTMRIRHSKRNGCQVEEGNRRVAERLKTAEKFGEDGNLEQAWYFVRLAIERMYTVTYIKYGPPNFNPLAWLDQTAESMWNSGVGNIVEQRKPGISNRLKDILNMTAAGAHDKSPRGFTDLANALKDLRSLLNILRIGNG